MAVLAGRWTGESGYSTIDVMTFRPLIRQKLTPLYLCASRRLWSVEVGELSKFGGAERKSDRFVVTFAQENEANRPVC